MKLPRYIASYLMLALAIATAAPAAAYARSDTEEAAKYRLQSVFLYNFISSVEWPRMVYTNDDKIIELCIIGTDKLGSVMDEVAAKAAIKSGVKINIRRGMTADEADQCNIVYISASEEPAIEQIIAKMQGKPVLTVSEIKNFAKRGGIIEFTLQSGNVRFNINNHLAKEYDLKINPQLLEAAQEVIN
jgi:hypothetical protein